MKIILPFSTLLRNSALQYRMKIILPFSILSGILLESVSAFTHASTLGQRTQAYSKRNVPFLPRGGSLYATVEVETAPIQGMRPGTSGLRKKVEVWSDTQNYVENFVQSLLDTAKQRDPTGKIDTLIVAGDGRYYNNEAMQRIFRVCAGNGVNKVLVPKGGIMSTPAVSAAIRDLDGGFVQGAIVLTASHNPGGPREDFGIKYNEGLGQPAGEEFTEAAYDRSLELVSYSSVTGGPDVNLNADIGTTFQITPSSLVVIIDPFEVYINSLKSCFDFDMLRSFWSRNDVSILFDGMHGAGGPFARRLLIEELGMSEDALMRCNPLPDFGGCHPDPNLTYADELVKKMGMAPDGSADESIKDLTVLPTLGAANDGDGDRNMIAGSQFFVTPSDSLALICDNWEAIPHFAQRGGPNGVARSMPSSAALDVVAQARSIPLFITPTGWKFFGNLMSSKELFDGKDYTPFLCGEESFGTGSDHIREKDGLWAVLAWMSIIANANKDVPANEPVVTVKDIVKKHWKKYGRHFYCRYDYEGVESGAADTLVDRIRELFVDGNIAENAPSDNTGIDLIHAEEFAYEDPVDGSKTSKQGLVLQFKNSLGDTSRVVFRLSGTGSSGATIRMYLEQYEKDSTKHDESAPIALRALADRAISLVAMQEITGREKPTVIT